MRCREGRRRFERAERAATLAEREQGAPAQGARADALVSQGE